MELNPQQEKCMKAAAEAYAGYCRYTNNKSLVSGADLPTWDNLPSSIRNAWYAGTQAALNFYMNS
jgi:hypothetical protein